MKDRKVKQVLSGGWYQWERGRHKERVKRKIRWKCYISMYEHGAVETV
jgi:hypothetical protein